MSRLMFLIVYPFFILGYVLGWMLQAFFVGMFGAKEHINELISNDSK